MKTQSNTTARTPSANSLDGQLKLVAEGKPLFTIVVPDNNDPLALEAAAELANAVEIASGAKLPILNESRLPAGPKVLIGKTRSAEGASLALESLTGLSCILKVHNGDLFLAGNDRSGFITGDSDYRMPASKKAVRIFLRDYLGARLLWPNRIGLGTDIPKNATLSFPANLNRAWKPVFETIAGAWPKWGFEFYTKYEAGVPYYTYDGHSYYSAVPAAKYGNDHPEYFALMNGVRDHAGGLFHSHLCIGNLEVQDLIYAEMLKRIDAGFTEVQLAQTDGYRPCACDLCKAIHPEPGERTWIVHNKLAQRLAKDRPNAKVAILSYGPTYDPPKTIAKFASNVVIELCRYKPEHFDAWRGRADKFLVYSYTWGSYQYLGFAAKSTPAMIARQVKFFRDQGVKGIYTCGYGESWGLEGPVYYIFQQCLDNPDCDWQAELDEFYRAAFGKAYNPMKLMYDALYERMDKNGGTANNTPDFPGKPKHLVEAAFTYFYPPDLLDFMEAKLAQAKILEPDGAVRARINLVERDFTYARTTANIFHRYHEYQAAPNWETFAPLAAAIRQRREFINCIYAKGEDHGDGPAELDGFPSMFVQASLDTALNGGPQYRAGLPAPATWNLEDIEKSKILPPAEDMKA